MITALLFLLSVAVFGDKETERLKAANRALLRTLREITVESFAEQDVGQQNDEAEGWSSSGIYVVLSAKGANECGTNSNGVEELSRQECEAWAHARHNYVNTWGGVPTNWERPFHPPRPTWPKGCIMWTQVHKGRTNRRVYFNDVDIGSSQSETQIVCKRKEHSPTVIVHNSNRGPGGPRPTLEQAVSVKQWDGQGDCVQWCRNNFRGLGGRMCVSDQCAGLERN